MINDNSFNDAREKINSIDSKMAELFEERMRAVSDIAAYKKEKGIPVVDKNREDNLLKTNVDLIDEEYKDYYVEFLQNTMDVSKQYQRKCIKGARIAYAGIDGAFAQIAASRIFPEAEIVSYRNFAEAYRAVEKGECDNAVLPIENSYVGEVGTVMDIMFGGGLYVNGLYTFQVEQCLLGTKDAKLEDVKKVISHPQALTQCETFIDKLNVEIEEVGNTAVAARQIAKEGDKTLAAIASREAAEIYGLKVLDAGISQDRDNSTRFAVFARNMAAVSEEAKNNHIILMFTVKDEAGALAKAINVIGAYGYNMSAVRSRPNKKLSWSYYFYVEADGDGNRANQERMLHALGATCDKLKIIGDMEGVRNQ
ncbi:MAG: chorismate mutase [Lachnospiraceae bacterium]|nr:chorismate mutase [Lachnospiraceae bacterium]